MNKFKTGDVVVYVGSGFWKKGQEHIIHKVEYRGRRRFEYSTNQGAWFEEKEFELVRSADARSFKQLDKDLRDEEML